MARVRATDGNLGQGLRLLVSVMQSISQSPNNICIRNCTYSISTLNALSGTKLTHFYLFQCPLIKSTFLVFKCVSTLRCEVLVGLTYCSPVVSYTRNLTHFIQYSYPQKIWKIPLNIHFTACAVELKVL